MPSLIVHMHLKQPLEEFLAFSRANIAHTRSFEGCLSFRQFQDMDDPAHFVTVQEWRSREDQARYRAWRSENGDIAKMQSLLAEPLQVCWLEEGDL
jgi:quinol monooxygenase YgiN